MKKLTLAILSICLSLSAYAGSEYVETIGYGHSSKVVYLSGYTTVDYQMCVSGTDGEAVVDWLNDWTNATSGIVSGSINTSNDIYIMTWGFSPDVYAYSGVSW